MDTHQQLLAAAAMGGCADVAQAGHHRSYLKSYNPGWRTAGPSLPSSVLFSLKPTGVGVTQTMCSLH